MPEKCLDSIILDFHDMDTPNKWKNLLKPNGIKSEIEQILNKLHKVHIKILGVNWNETPNI